MCNHHIKPIFQQKTKLKSNFLIDCNVCNMINFVDLIMQKGQTQFPVAHFRPDNGEKFQKYLLKCCTYGKFLLVANSQSHTREMSTHAKGSDEVNGVCVSVCLSASFSWKGRNGRRGTEQTLAGTCLFVRGLVFHSRFSGWNFMYVFLRCVTTWGAIFSALQPKSAGVWHSYRHTCWVRV